MWPHGGQSQDEDSSGLDYMLNLSLRSDGEPVAGGVEGKWSDIWDNNAGKTSNISVNSSLSRTNNNYPFFTAGTSISAVQDHDQTGDLLSIRILSRYSVFSMLMI